MSVYLTNKELCRLLIQRIGSETPGSIQAFTPAKLEGLPNLIRIHLGIIDLFQIEDLCNLMKEWWFVQIFGRFNEIATPREYICEDPPYSAENILFLMSWINHFRDTTNVETTKRIYTMCLDFLIAWNTLGRLTNDPGKGILLRDWSNALTARVAMATYDNAVGEYIEGCLVSMREVIDKANLRIKTLSETPVETPVDSPVDSPVETSDEGDAGRDAM